MTNYISNDPLGTHVLQVSWEYPPVIVGGLGRHVGALSAALRDHRMPLTVLTRAPDGTHTLVESPGVLRAPAGPPFLDFATQLLEWVRSFNRSLLRNADGRLPRIDVVHAHDWLVADAAQALARELDVPLVTTIHATEAGRHLGWLPKPLNRTIHQTEGALVRASSQVITCSRQMRNEVLTLHNVDPARVRVIPNGIDLDEWRRPGVPVREATTDGPNLLYAGRLVHEKGVQDVIDALPAIRRAVPGTTFTIAGSGKIEAELRERAAAQNVSEAVRFCGHLSPSALRDLMVGADLAVVPSRYEPFGIVALEFTALGVPLVVTDVGGLGEYAARTGTSAVPTADPVALAAAVIDRLRNTATTRDQVHAAQQVLATDFAWEHIAHETIQVYRDALDAPLRLTAPDVDRHIEPVRGNLLYGDRC